MIIGRDILDKLGIILDFKTNVIEWDSMRVPMRDPASLREQEELLEAFAQTQEPENLKDAHERVNRILDSKYEKADLPKLVKDNCSHLSATEQRKLLQLLISYEDLFDGTLGDFQTSPISLELKPGEEPVSAKAFPVPKIHEAVFKKELDRLESIGVLKKCSNSPWVSPTFIIPKKNGRVRFITDFRKVNAKLVRKPYPIPKISDLVQKLEGFSYATALDLNMGYYTLRLDPDAQKICTLITPFGKYQYLR